MYDIQKILDYAEQEDVLDVDTETQNTSMLHRQLGIKGVCGGCGNYTCTCKYHEQKRDPGPVKQVQKYSPSFTYSTKLEC